MFFLLLHHVWAASSAWPNTCQFSPLHNTFSPFSGPKVFSPSSHFSQCPLCSHAHLPVFSFSWPPFASDTFISHPDYSHYLFFLLSSFPSPNWFYQLGTFSSYIILTCSKLVTNINWLSDYWKIKRSPDSRFSQTLQWNPNQYCLIGYAHYAPSQMSARILQTDLTLSLSYAFALVALLENSAFPFSFLNPSVFQFWSYLLSEISLTTQNKPKLPHPLWFLCFTGFKVSTHSFIYLQHLFKILLWGHLDVQCGIVVVNEFSLSWRLYFCIYAGLTPQSQL